MYHTLLRRDHDREFKAVYLDLVHYRQLANFDFDNKVLHLDHECARQASQVDETQ